MPFVVYSGEARVCSLDYITADVWSRLKADRERVAALRMPCCGAGVVPKTSTLGLPFFAHHPGDACSANWSHESAEHQLYKAEVRQFLNSLPGWTADVEVPGPGRAWVADVLASHDSGLQLAVEVQLSRQVPEQFADRSARYADTGIRCVWLVHSRGSVTAHQVAHLVLPPEREPGRPPLVTIGTTWQWGQPRDLAMGEYLTLMAEPALAWSWNGQPAPPVAAGTTPALSGGSGASRYGPSGHGGLGLPVPRDDRDVADPDRIRALYARLNEAAERGHW